MLIEETSEAERLFLWRHRRNVPRHVAASDLGVDVETYADWEEGRQRIRQWDSAATVLVDCVLPPEHFILLRRRAGMTQPDVARAIGCCKQHISRMERGEKSLDALQEFWGQV